MAESQNPAVQAWLDRADTLIVTQKSAKPSGELEIFLAMTGDGAVTAFNGHVDLGTGIATALAQIVAEELDVAVDRVAMVLGSITAGPDQGPTVASITIQVSAVPLRQAAAQARRFLIGVASQIVGIPIDQLTVEDGVVLAQGDPNVRLSYGSLLEGQRHHLTLDETVPVKATADYRVVGRAVPRSDIPAKAAGTFTYVHDMRLPGMLHGRVVRPPYSGIDGADLIGSTLIAVDEASIADIPGVVKIVVIRDFVGVVAVREEHAELAARRLRVTWRSLPDIPDLTDLATAIRTNPSTPRTLLEKGDIDQALGAAATRMRRSYIWPYQMHGSIGPSCSVADYQDDRLTVWSGTQNPHALRGDLARLMQMPESVIEVIRLEAAGCYGRNCADDVGADAALLSRAVGRPVRVQLTREQEHGWEPKGAGQVMDIDGGLTADGEVAGYHFSTHYPSGMAPTLALILTGTIPPKPIVVDSGDRTAIPPYAFDHMRIVANDMPPIVRSAWLRGVSALPNSFAHESYIDELAIEAKIDPIEFRLRYLDDPRAVDLVKALAERVGWQKRTEARRLQADDGLLRGQGFAYALYVHSKFPGFGAAWSAWVAEVTVDPATGEVAITRVVAGQDTGLMINPAGVKHQLHGNVIQSISRTLKEEVSFSRKAVTDKEWGAYPILTFPEVPTIETLLVPRPNEPPVGAGESASVPSAAAIANAIFDATGVRFREPPFTPERVKAALEAAKPPAKPAPRRGLKGLFAGALGAALGVGVMALPWRAAIAPITPPGPGIYAAATIARGAQLAALGDCAVCHTAPGGEAMAGGRRLETPFGAIYSPNITADAETGIGSWSYAAFERAMREGIHRDGSHLYPVFPYTSFTKTSDADLQALYAYLTTLAPVRATAAPSELRFPFNLRPLLAAWNLLFLRTGEVAVDPAQSAAWNRGAYLVNGLGHCGGCHTERNLLGAEKTGSAALGGGVAEGWDAPALTSLSAAPVPWTEQAFFDYLRTGYSPHHGVAAGAMAPVVRELALLPGNDIRAMATYLASLSPDALSESDADAAARAAEARSAADYSPGVSPGGRLYDGACAPCHQNARGAELVGIKPSMTLNSNVHAASPDNLIRTILDGIDQPARADLGAMPAFRDTLTDRQVADIVAYIRTQFAPAKQAWSGIEASVARLRSLPAEQTKLSLAGHSGP